MALSSGIPADLRPTIEARLRDLGGNGGGSGTELRIRCPNPDHEDAHPSASWNWTKAAWNCQACGDSGGWKRFCQLTGIPLNGNGNGRTRKPSPQRLEHYDYPAADGRIRRKIRTEPKGFRWCVVDDCGKEITPKAAGVSGNPQRLYRLDQVREGIRHGLPIIAVEGEKAADRIASLGLIATCNPEGAAKVGQRPKWRDNYAEALSKADLVVCGDLDPAGQAHAAVTAESSSRFAALVRVLDLAALARSCGFELPEKAGLDDWIDRRRQEGASRADIAHQLTEWIESLEDYCPAAETEGSSETNAQDLSIDFADFIAIEYPPREWILTDLLQVRDTVMVHSWRGVGKSLFALGIALAVATGSDFLRFRAPRRRAVLYIDGEMPREDIQERFKRMHAGMAPHLPRPALRTISADVLEYGLPSLASSDGRRAVEATLAAARKAGRPIELIVIDSQATLCRASEDSNREESWHAMQDWLLALRRAGVAVLIVHHDGKTGRQRGTSAIEDVCTQVLQLKRPESSTAVDGARFEVHYTKSRGVYGAAAAPLVAEIRDPDSDGLDWLWAPLEDRRADQRREVYALKGEGLSVRDIAKRTGVARSTVSDWLKKRS